MGKCQEGSLFPGYSPNVSPGFEPGSLGGHVLAASLTINCCLVLFFSSIRLVKLVSCKLGEQCPAALTIRNLTEDHPWVIGKIVTEQLTSWVPMIFSIYLLISTDVTSFPFYGGTCSHVITLAFCVYVGRAVFLMLQDMYLSRHLSKWWLSSLYHCVSVFCYGTMIFSGQNTLLGCAGLITKGQSAFLDLLWIFKLCEMPTHDRRYATMAILASLTSIFFRFVLPIWFVLSACLKQSPLAMHPVPLAALCLSFVFFGAMNAWFIYRSVKKVMKSLKAKQVAKLESIVKSKVPEVLHIPMSERNILSPTRALSDSTALRNSSLGFSFHNNFPFSNSKAEKTPFNVILMRQDEERDSGYFQTQLDMTLNRSSSTSSSHSDTHMHRTRHASDFEDIFLSSVEGDPIT